jgi:hypothetical protein
MQPDDAKRVKGLERENATLKRFRPVRTLDALAHHLEKSRSFWLSTWISMSWPNEADASRKVDFDLAVESDHGRSLEARTAHPPELSRVVSRTGPQHAWLSEIQ